MALAHAILASLLGGPRTGYDLAKQFGATGHYWRATHQQVYRELARLEDESAIRAADDGPGARGDRRRGITKAGRTLLAEWARLPAEPATIKEDILVKCLALGVIDPGTLADQIARQREQHDTRLRHHRAMLDDLFPAGPPTDPAELGRYLALAAGVSYERAWIEWADLAGAALASASERPAPPVSGPGDG